MNVRFRDRTPEVLEKLRRNEPVSAKELQAADVEVELDANGKVKLISTLVRLEDDFTEAYAGMALPGGFAAIAAGGGAFAALGVTGPVGVAVGVVGAVIGGALGSTLGRVLLRRAKDDTEAVERFALQRPDEVVDWGSVTPAKIAADLKAKGR